MTHPERDQDLLLFAHRALPPLKAVSIHWHLARCPDCRRRLDQLQASSLGLAGVIRGNQRPQWSFPASAAPLGTGAAWLLAVVAVAILTVILLGTLVIRERQHLSVSSPTPVGSSPCRPDLPSDRCR